MGKMFGVQCGVSETSIGSYRGYEIFFVEQVDLITEEPLKDGSKWYLMVNRSNPLYPIGEEISTSHRYGVERDIDYRLDVRPKRRVT